MNAEVPLGTYIQFELFNGDTELPDSYIRRYNSISRHVCMDYLARTRILLTGYET